MRVRCAALTLFMTAGLALSAPPARAAQAWSPAIDLSVAGQAADASQVASAGSTTIITLRRSNGSNQIVQAARSTDAGQTWSTPVDVSQPGRDAATPQIAMSGSTAVITWRRSNGTNQVVQAAHSTDGGLTWSTPQDVSPAGQDASQPQLAVSGSTGVITWYRSNGTSQIVQAARTNDGGQTWSTATDLSAPGRDAVYPTVAVSGSTAIVTWYRTNGSNQIVQAARSIDGGSTWSTPIELSVPGYDAVYPNVAMQGSTAIITWRRFNGANTIVQTARSTDGGASWAAPVDLSTPGQSAISSRVAMAGTTAVVIWRRSNGTSFIAQAARSTDGGLTWTTPVDLSAPGRDVTAPQIAMNGSTAIGTWYRSNGTNMIVQAAQSLDAGQTWSDAVDLSAPGQNAFYPQVSIGSGAAHVVWYRSNGTHFIVQASSRTIPSNATGAAPATVIFRFVLPHGRECTSISPQVVENGSAYVLPGDAADCRTPGSIITGWRIPGQDWAFRPDHTVIVVDSQVFTVVLREPVVHVILDANVDDTDACLDPAGRAATVRTSDLFLQRPGMAVPGRALQPSITTYPAPSAAPCVPPGHRFEGWNTRGDGRGTAIASGSALTTAIDDDENTAHLFATWSAIPRGTAAPLSRS